MLTVIRSWALLVVEMAQAPGGVRALYVNVGVESDVVRVEEQAEHWAGLLLVWQVPQVEWQS